MQLPAPITKTGYFWLPEDEDKRLPGTLAIDESGASELEALGVFCDEKAIFSESTSIGRIVGILEDGKPVTLERCYYKSRQSNPDSISKCVIKARLVLIGCRFETGETAEFDGFRLSVPHLDEWLCISGIKSYRDATGSHEIVYERPQEVKIPVSDELTLAVAWSWKTNDKLTEASVSQKANVKVSAATYLAPHEIRSLAYKITTFLSFVMDRIVNMDSLGVTSSRITRTALNDQVHVIPIPAYYESLPLQPERPGKALLRPLVPYEAIADKLDTVVRMWLDAYERIQPVLDLYFAAKSEAYKFIDGEFLSLAQGLETFHRRISDETEMDSGIFQTIRDKLVDSCPEHKRSWLCHRLAYANELTLRKRLKRMIKPFEQYFGNKRQRSEFVDSVVKTRNWLTHYDQSLKDEACYGADLLGLSRRLECLIELHMLRELGLSDDEICKMVEQNKSFMEKLNPDSLKVV